MSDTNTSSDLLLLTQAAHAARNSRGNFHRLIQRELVPPPVIALPQRRWSAIQLERWRMGEIRANENGIWFEWDSELEGWRKLPNQYLNIMPLDVA